MKKYAENYTKSASSYEECRPEYPTEVVQWMIDKFGLNKQSVVADIGSGTGRFSRLLLPVVKRIYAIEPNSDMRKIAENNIPLSYHNKFVSVNGDAENTTLAEHSVNFITCAESFHWFNTIECKKEFLRIMNNSSEIGNGYILLLWDALVRNSNAFIEEYREYILSRQSTKVPFNAPGTIIEGEIHNAKFLHSKNFDWSALLGYVKSYGSMVVTELIESELKNIFYKHAVNGIVTLDYTCDVYAGKLK